MGSKNGILEACAIDPADNSVYVVGSYEFTPGNKDWLIRKYAQDGMNEDATPKIGNLASFRPAAIGGSGEDIAYDVAVDSAGNVFVVGVIYDTAATSGNEDWTIYAFNPDGTKKWDKQLGGRDGVLTGVAVDFGTIADTTDDKVITVGYYTNYISNTGAGSGKDWLIRVYDQAGNNQSGNHLWSRKIGQNGEDIPYDVAVDSTGRVIVAGTIEDLSGSSGQDWTTYSFSRDGTTSDGIGNWKDQMGGKDGALKGVAIDPTDDSVVVVGHYPNFVGGSTGLDWLIRKYAQDGMNEDATPKIGNLASWRPAAQGGAGEDVAEAVAIGNGKVYVAGFHTNLVDGLSGKDGRVLIYDSSDATSIVEVIPFN
jgi:hypothetical protein